MGSHGAACRHRAALLEASASGLVDLKGLVDRFLEGVMTDGAVEEGVLATTMEHARSLNVVPPAAMLDDQKIAPASVGATLRVVRFRSRTASRVSTLRTASLRLEAPEPLDRPAWRNPPARATATKAVRSPRSAPISLLRTGCADCTRLSPNYPGAISMRQQGDG